MRIYVATCLIGSFAFDKDKNILLYKLFPKDVELISDRLAEADRKEITSEEREIVEELKESGAQEVVWDKADQIEGISCIQKEDNPAQQILRDEFRKLAIDLKWTNSQAEINQMLTKVNIELSKKKLRQTKKDIILIQVVNTYDSIEENMNTISEHIREWYGLYFPELTKSVADHQKFIELVAKYGTRENFREDKLSEIAKKSAGMDFDSNDIKAISDFAETMKIMYQTKEKLSQYVEKLATEIAPNASAIATPIITARMISLAGGIERMAKMPSSTIQLLGAERALFRHLKGQGRAPKYGVLFLHPYVQNSPKAIRGKVARLLASKISLAVKIDKYSKKDQSAQMKKEVARKIDELQKTAKKK
ncbi:MAG: hypothetical protein JW716_00045 [Candidatus Aenigmarchaeota archaeon]|nr:hypothetical protein [Candidatus Aenigmarchaeota archaeon]